MDEEISSPLKTEYIQERGAINDSFKSQPFEGRINPSFNQPTLFKDLNPQFNQPVRKSNL
jgi:hypothetical protein